MHIHLDAVGGVSGDMFIGAVLDVFPLWADDLPRQLEAAGFSDLVTLQTQPKNDGVLAGTIFQVSEKQQPHHHHHRSYRLIRETITASQLSAGVKTAALGIFQHLAEAEAEVHGKAVDDVHFHEVGAWDSIADVVCAAYLIDKLSQVYDSLTWSVSALPAGKGLVDTAHGKLPLPAPAVALLLKGFAFCHDDIEGERVTPTGAAIVKYLLPRGSGQQSSQAPGILQTSGIGFGSKEFPGLSNVLRVLTYQPTANTNQAWQIESVTHIRFEVDDQSAEDLSIALQNLRAVEGVLDACYFPLYGKKERIAFAVQILANPAAQDKVVNACFNQCPTIGLRLRLEQRAVLPRQEGTVEHEGETYRVKTVTRPNGKLSAKIEMDDLTKKPATFAERQEIRRAVEEKSIQIKNGEGSNNE